MIDKIPELDYRLNVKIPLSVIEALICILEQGRLDDRSQLIILKLKEELK